jgi:hypothetical protein
MEPFEVFRAYLVSYVALQLGMSVESRTTWEIWTAIHEECPEAARIASDQWLERDLLAEHLLYDDSVRNLNDIAKFEIDTADTLSGLASYVRKWQQFNLRIQAAMVKRPKVDTYSFWSSEAQVNPLI